MHGADEIGREDERALEHRDDQQVVVVLAGDLLGKLEVAPGDGGCGEQDLDVLAPDHWH
jgi:hypothetical protein